MTPISASDSVVENINSQAIIDILENCNSTMLSMVENMIENSQDFTAWGLPSGDEQRLIRLISARKRLINSSFKFQLKKLFNQLQEASEHSAIRNSWRASASTGFSNYSGPDSNELQMVIDNWTPVYDNIFEKIHQRLRSLTVFNSIQAEQSPLNIDCLCMAYRSSIESLNLDYQYKVALYRQYSDQFIGLLGPLLRQVEKRLQQNHCLSQLPLTIIDWRSSSHLSESDAPRSITITRLTEVLFLLFDMSNRIEVRDGDISLQIQSVKSAFVERNISYFDETLNNLDTTMAPLSRLSEQSVLLKQKLPIFVHFLFVSIIQSETPVDELFLSLKAFVDSICDCHYLTASTGTDSVLDDEILKEVVNLIQINQIDSNELDKSAAYLQSVLTAEKNRIISEEAKLKNQQLWEKSKQTTADLIEPLKNENRPLILFDQIWTPLLYQVAIQHGVESARWQRTVTLINTQVWALVPKRTIADQDKLLATLPHLKRSLNKAMISLKIAPKTQRSLKQLQQLEHQEIIKKTEQLILSATRLNSAEQSDNNNDFIDTLQMVRKVKSRTSEALIDNDEEDSEVTQTTFLVGGELAPEPESADFVQSHARDKPTIAEKTLKGDWFVYIQQKSENLIKVIWKAEDSSFFIFVDRDGNRVLEIDHETLQDKFNADILKKPATTELQSTRQSYSILRSF